MDNLLVVISGPSGGGKGTIINELLTRDENYKRVSTYTTRPMREGEKNGEQYYFITEEEYKKLKSQGKLMACSTIDGYHYRSTYNRYGR